MPHLAPESDTVWPDGLVCLLGGRALPRPRGIDTASCTAGAWKTLMRQAGVLAPFASSLPVMAVADGQMFCDGGVRGFLRDADLQTLGDWVVDGRMLGVPDALLNCDDSPLRRFYALRVRSLLRDRFFAGPAAPPEFRALEALCSTKSPSKLITKLYNAAQEQSGGLVMPARAAWERDLGEPIPDGMWRSCCAHMRTLSPNYRLRLLHFKFLHRIYYTPRKLHSMGLVADPRCVRCSAPDAGFFHLAWECEEVYKYWEEVRQRLLI
ncbi:hypothetical protein NDU88_002473 [Pleurodeles waltl]|uniref:Reverse transcriptase zinc-binding domain-containing protein n=1 Tax=Pleurodeles waltl TaxID=8319 RepID=A0AAV7UWA5_PLEWA|nr:hypothetical protein NDU88_002473 [Pleurodeles waltl]